MYDITNKSEVVREIKRYLYLVSEYLYPEIGRNTIDGIYDSQTAESVKKYQKAKMLKETGEVDYETFKYLFSDYDGVRKMLNAKGYVLTDNGFPISFGDMNEDVRIIHCMIGELKQVYTELYDVGNGSFFSKRTAASVRMLREIFGFESGEHVDEALYQRMKIELDSHKRNTRTNDLKGEKRV